MTNTRRPNPRDELPSANTVPTMNAIRRRGTGQAQRGREEITQGRYFSYDHSNRFRPADPTKLSDGSHGARMHRESPRPFAPEPWVGPIHDVALSRDCPLPHRFHRMSNTA